MTKNKKKLGQTMITHNKRPDDHLSCPRLSIDGCLGCDKRKCFIKKLDKEPEKKEKEQKEPLPYMPYTNLDGGEPRQW
jgi:hypothetical protein